MRTEIMQMGEPIRLQTLARAKDFEAYIRPDGIELVTGRKGTPCFIETAEAEACIGHFRQRGWFALGNNMTAVQPNGLGEYFQQSMGKSPKFASHFAALMVSQNKLECRRDNGKIELKVKSSERSNITNTP
ncbi:MAG: hypothetical protein V2A77_04455 [Pseudomonadota bacterium]